MSRESPRSLDPCVQHLIDLMRRFGVVRARAMFGGHGLYRDDLMFALLAGGVLYLKVDEQTAPLFTEKALHPFGFTARGRTVRLSYHEAPPEVLEDEVAMAAWCGLAWEAALRARAAGATRGRKRAHLPGDSDVASDTAAAIGGHGAAVERGQRHAERLGDLPNLGPRSIEWLSAAGITSPERLQELGAVRAFVRARARNPGVSLNLLWALEGALTGRRWQDVAETDRASLLMALEDVQRQA